MTTQVTGAYADIHAWENLCAAYRKTARGKRGRRRAAFGFRLELSLSWHGWSPDQGRAGGLLY